MPFESILFTRPGESVPDQSPDFFGDLNLDQIVEAVTAGREAYNLKPFFCVPLHSADAVLYRQEVMQDLQAPAVQSAVGAFAQRMRSMREHLAQAEKLHYQRQKESWFLAAVAIYAQAVTGLAADLAPLALHSRGLTAFRASLTAYAAGDEFTALVAETRQLQADLASVRYFLLIGENQVTVRRYAEAPDYSDEVQETFARFRQGAVQDYLVRFSDWAEMNHVEAAVLDMVARLYPEIFTHLTDYCAARAGYLDPVVAAFDREVQFYLAYLDFIAQFERVGLPFCYPQVSATSKEVYSQEGFDLALAPKLTREHSPVVCNDFYLRGRERIFVVTGPNQGGKTTFARAFGQLHYLASLGLPVPGRAAQLFLSDRLFTHFEREENLENLRGKLEDDLVRMHAILEACSDKSIVVINEMFSSTTLSDAISLGRKVLERLTALDVLGVYVTFIDELTTFSAQTVSLVSTVLPENPELRTFKIVRQPADGLSYAIAIAEKYRVTYERIKERIQA